MRSAQQTKLALSIVAFLSVAAGGTGLHAQNSRLAALDMLRGMGLDSADGAATVYFRPPDRTRALELQSMMREFLGFWNPRLNVELHVRLAVLQPDDWSKLTPLPYGLPHYFIPPANLLPAPAVPPAPKGLDLLLIEGGRDTRDWLIVGHEGGHLLTLALLPPEMRDSLADARAVLPPWLVGPPAERDPPAGEMPTALRQRFERLGAVPQWFREYAATYFMMTFLEATRRPEAAVWTKYLRASTAIATPRFTHLDDWFGELMVAKAPDGTPYFLSPDGGPNFGWYQGVVARLAAHVQSRSGTDAVSHIRRVTSGEASPTTAEIVEELEAMAPGARALLDELGAGYRRGPLPVPARSLEFAGGVRDRGARPQADVDSIELRSDGVREKAPSRIVD